MSDDNPEETFGHVAERLNDYKLAYLHLINPAAAQVEKGLPPEPRALRMVELIRSKYRGRLMLCGGFDRDSAENWLAMDRADVIAFGRKFIANPDLPERLRSRAPLNQDDPSTYYGGGAKGYTDYPSLAQERGEQPEACVDETWR
jgi:N-ethylmaleimide reductase